MRKTFLQRSGRLSELRETDIRISGGLYSAKFLKSLKDIDGGYIASSAHKDGRVYASSVWELLEIKEDDNGEILWNTVEEMPRRDTEWEFSSSLGLFRSVDLGEFGGQLETPTETLHGNFREMFEFCGKVYAIDTLNHMGCGHTRIYEFDGEKEHKLLYDTDGDADTRYFLSLSALTIGQENIRILISGLRLSRELLGKGRLFSDGIPCSILFEITPKGFFKLAEFDLCLESVYNMIVKSNKMILGMDKVVAVADISTKEIKAYTPITPKAEEDLFDTSRARIF